MLDKSDYDKLERALVDVASGDEKPRPKTIVTTRDERDSNGKNVHVTQTSHKNDADVRLAMMLLDGRIGGPQDWC